MIPPPDACQTTARKTPGDVMVILRSGSFPASLDSSCALTAGAVRKPRTTMVKRARITSSWFERRPQHVVRPRCRGQLRPTVCRNHMARVLHSPRRISPAVLSAGAGTPFLLGLRGGELL